MRNVQRVSFHEEFVEGRREAWACISRDAIAVIEERADVYEHRYRTLRGGLKQVMSSLKENQPLVAEYLLKELLDGARKEEDSDAVEPMVI